MRFLVLRLGLSSTFMLATLAAVTAGEPLGNGFTYQGQLKQQGAPLDGNVDLRIALFGVEINGVPLGELDITDVSVANGLFAVELDFGATAFNGEVRWLELAIRSPHDPTDTEAFTTLTPRQALMATPRALQTRGLFVDDAGNVGIGTELPEWALHVESSNAIGALAKATGADGYGVFGISSSDFGFGRGGSFRSNGTQGYGVYGSAGAETGATYGVFGTSASTGGSGVRGIATSASGTTYGVKAETRSPEGYAGYFEGGRSYFEGNVGIGTNAPESETNLHIQARDNDFGVLVDAVGATGSEIGLHAGASGYSSLVKNAFYDGGWSRFDDTKGAFLHEIEPDGYLRLKVTPPGSGTIGWTTALSVNTDGEVGIGTTEPFSQLQVETDNIDAVFAKTTDSGGWAVRGFATSFTGTARGGSFNTNASGGTGVYGQASALSGTTYAVRGKTTSADGYAGYFEGGRNYFENRVGIGTTTPSTDVKLHLAGTDANLLLREAGGNPYIEIGDTLIAKGYLQWFSSTNKMLLYTSGHAYPVAIGRTDLGGLFIDTETNGSDVGIGTESPQYKLHVAGSAGKPGGGSWSNSSDRRLKKNIQDLDGSLDRLMQLRSVTFEYKNPESINELPGTRIGMIAQEVEEVFPDWVNDGEHGYKTVTFRGFEALTVEALRELREEKDRQLAVKDDEIRELRAANADLQSRMAQLETLVAALAGIEKGGK